MLLILKQKRLARTGALKALDFATTRCPANCERFVDQFGLKTIFAIFMGKAKVNLPLHSVSEVSLTVPRDLIEERSRHGRSAHMERRAESKAPQASSVVSRHCNRFLCNLTAANAVSMPQKLLFQGCSYMHQDLEESSRMCR